MQELLEFKKNNPDLDVKIPGKKKKNSV